MRGGKLDRIVTIEKRTRTQGEGGELVDSWDDVLSGPQFAEWIRAKGIERYLGAQLAATVTGAFRLRWFPSLFDIYPDTHRIKYSNLMGVETVCLLKGCTEIERRQGVIVYWESRTEAPPDDIPDAEED